MFAALPLLLQSALVLFLAGLIDFSAPLGPKLMIPISIIVGMTLLFLAATTILPSLQGLSFLCRLYPGKIPPTPCPFKSPQSDAFRTLFAIILRAIFRVFPLPSLHYGPTPPSSRDWKWIIKNPPSFMPTCLAPSAYNIWYRKTWLTYDLEWLSLRDACHQRILDDDQNLYQHRISWEDTFPLSDVTQYLVQLVRQTPGTKHTESFLAALVHCFQEISESIWTAPQTSSEIQRKDRRNHYFEQLHWNPPCSMSTFLLHGGAYKSDRFSERNFGFYKYLEPKIKQRLFCDDQTLIFLRTLLANHNSPKLAKYQLELWSRILHFSSHTAPLTPAVCDGVSVPIPTIMETPTMNSLIPNYLSGKPLELELMSSIVLSVER